MLTNLIKRKFPSPPSLPNGVSKSVSLQPGEQSPLDCFEPAAKPGLGKLLVSASMLALAAGSQAVSAAEAHQQAITQQQEIDLVLSSTRAADTAVDPLLGEKWRTPDQVQGKDGGKLYHFTGGALARVTAKEVTGEMLAPGAPRLTARGVDPHQGSKQYPEGQVHWRLTEPFKECTAFAADGSCTETRWETISYQNISCLYRNEDTGEIVRVLHRSTANSDMNQMNKGVCAGHRLVKGSDGFWGPVQSDPHGKTLYVNPLNIVEIQSSGVQSKK